MLNLFWSDKVCSFLPLHLLIPAVSLSLGLPEDLTWLGLNVREDSVLIGSRCQIKIDILMGGLVKQLDKFCLVGEPTLSCKLLFGFDQVINNDSLLRTNFALMLRIRQGMHEKMRNEIKVLMNSQKSVGNNILPVVFF